MDIPGALSTLTNGLANIYDKPAFNTVGTLFDTLLTNTPPPQSTAAEKEEDKSDVESGNGAAGANNGTPATTTSTSLTKEKMDKIIEGLKRAGIPITDPNIFYNVVQNLTQ